MRMTNLRRMGATELEITWRFPLFPRFQMYTKGPLTMTLWQQKAQASSIQVGIPLASTQVSWVT